MGTIPGQLPKVIIFGNPNPFNNAVRNPPSLRTGMVSATQQPVSKPTQQTQTQSSLGVYGEPTSSSSVGNNQGGSNTTPGVDTSSTTETTAGTMGGFGGGGGGGMAEEEKSMDAVAQVKNHKLRNMLLIAAGIGIIILVASKGKNKSALKSII